MHLNPMWENTDKSKGAVAASADDTTAPPGSSGSSGSGAGAGAGASGAGAGDANARRKSRQGSIAHALEASPSSSPPGGHGSASASASASASDHVYVRQATQSSDAVEYAIPVAEGQFSKSTLSSLCLCAAFATWKGFREARACRMCGFCCNEWTRDG